MHIIFLFTYTKNLPTLNLDLKLFLNIFSFYAFKSNNLNSVL